jgi:hypothetical protein
MSPWAKWFFIGVVLQLGFWMAFTVAVGAPFGGAALILEERKGPSPSTKSSTFTRSASPPLSGIVSPPGCGTCSSF